MSWGGGERLPYLQEWWEGPLNSWWAFSIAFFAKSLPLVVSLAFWLRTMFDNFLINIIKAFLVYIIIYSN